LIMKVLDLFCGAGGFSSGFAALPGSHLAIDANPIPLATYFLNYPHALMMQNDIGHLHSQEIKKVLGRPDIIIASPPCEEFSLANPRSMESAAERIYGTGTARLFLDTIRIIADLEPAVFVIENVAAIMRSGGREIIEREMDYYGLDEVYFNLVRAQQHGNPSKRLRVFISNLSLSLPRKQPPTVMEAIGDLPPLGIDALFSSAEEIPNHTLHAITESQLKQVKKARPRQGTRHFRTSHHKTLTNWVRLPSNRVATSIIGLSRYIHPRENRLLSVREHARLMSYPDDFIFTGHLVSQYEQVGESVPPLISHLIAEEVVASIE
jgi:DNA (cytosine-5)-methyltransferase 1